ncbi:hypothetical protein SAMN06269250_5370 [Spirosoma fluviale]|uniref:Uncharacterized protein n=1 Tax=Spirosoma fluviale TaxID=1597977 RepID=A0A286GNL6_9BACT|nr:hypothetical protein SAMN06269250_5370 [Spirosoma fluviale]
MDPVMDLAITVPVLITDMAITGLMVITVRR